MAARRAMPRRSPSRSEAPSAKPAGGWLGCTTVWSTLPRIRLPTSPSRIALDAARSVAQGARPGSHLLSWIGEWSDTPLRWSPAVTKQLFAVLTDGDVRAWRFLETTGVLERALPELAEAVDRRRNDPFLLDPSQVLRFTLVERIRGDRHHRSEGGGRARKAPTPRVAAARGADPRYRRRGLTGPARAAHRPPARSRRRRGAADRAARGGLGPAASCGPEGRRARRRACHAHCRSTSTTPSGPVRSTC